MTMDINMVSVAAQITNINMVSFRNTDYGHQHVLQWQHRFGTSTWFLAAT